jgi:hypothetical protein
MRNLILVSLFVSADFISRAQADSAKVEQAPGYLKSHHCSINFGYGKARTIKPGPFGNYFLESYGQDFANEVSVFGFDIISPLFMGGGASPKDIGFESCVGFNYRYSSQLDLNDTTYYSYGAADFNLAAGYDLFNGSESIDLVFRAGLDVGVAALNNSGKWYRNPFVDAILQVQPRILLGPIALSFKAEFGFDLSSQSWKPYGISNDLALKNHYRMMMVSVGYVFR